MARIINFRSFNVFTLELEHWDYGYHNHNFYEIILIESGKGRHRLNDVEFAYKKSDIFLLAPADKHEFVIEKKTAFIYIKYTEQFLLDLLLLRKNNDWKDALLLTLSGSHLVQDSVIADKADATHVFQLAKLLLYEFSQKLSYNHEIIADIFSSLLTLLARNINKITGKEKWLSLDGEKIEKVLSYIRIHALDKEYMRIERIAKEFLMSASYISIFVKKHTGLSVQNHVIQYKIKAAEKLLKQSKYNVNEIADNLGFNDASHFNKIFKKYNHMSPQQFRSMG